MDKMKEFETEARKAKSMKKLQSVINKMPNHSLLNPPDLETHSSEILQESSDGAFLN